MHHTDHITTNTSHQYQELYAYMVAALMRLLLQFCDVLIQVAKMIRRTETDQGQEKQHK